MTDTTQWAPPTTAPPLTPPGAHDVSTTLRSDGAWYAACATCGWYSTPEVTEYLAEVAAGRHHQAITPTKKSRKGWIVGGVGLLLVGVIAAAGGASEDSPGATRPSSGSASVAGWATSYGAADSAAISAATNTMADAANSLDMAEVIDGCGELLTAVAVAEGHLPTPDVRLTAALRGAYENYDLSARACMDGSIDVSSSYMVAATAYIVEATEIMSGLR